MLKTMRRITAGVDTRTSESLIVSNEQVDVLIPYPQYPCFKLQNIFYTEDNFQSLETRHLDKPYEIQLPIGAMRFLKIRMPTITEMTAELKTAGQDIPKDWAKFNLHSTDSVDYIYILSGKITCIVGEQQIQLQEGDFLAQVGPEHTWVNDHNEPCYVLCAMVGIKPSENRKKMLLE
jgi:mannose-6-phosphate isomerase-like protein (cupin superfamily)